MLAFHGKSEIKEKYVQRVKFHREHDDLTRGVYWTGVRGCAVGCTIEQTYDVHKTFEKELGIPEALVYLEDTLFECMTWEKALDLPLRFLQSIEVGADLSSVMDQLLLYILSDEKVGLYRVALEKDKDIIVSMVALINRKLQGENVSREEWGDTYSLFKNHRPRMFAGRINRIFEYAEQAVLRVHAFYTSNEPDVMGFIMYAGSAYGYNNDSPFPYALNSWMDNIVDKLIELLENSPVVNMLTKEPVVHSTTAHLVLEEIDG